MATLNVVDQNTGRLVEINTASPTGNLYVKDSDGNLIELNLESPSGNFSVIDSNTGERKVVDYSNPTAVFNVIDPNTGNFVEIDTANPTGTLYCIDQKTGEFVELDLSTDEFITFITTGGQIGVLGSVGGDSVAPTVAITSSQSGITALSPFSVTITFSEPVTGFVVGDITVGNGTAGNFSGSGAVYTADITPTAAGTVTVDIGAGVCTDLAGNANEAATQFSIISLLGFTLVEDYTDISVLYQDTGRTTPVTTDGQSILGVTDKSPAGNNMSQANGGLYKVNIQNGKSAMLLNGASQYMSTANNIITGGDWTEIIAFKATSTTGTSLVIQGTFGASTSLVDITNPPSGILTYVRLNADGINSPNISSDGARGDDAAIVMITFNNTTKEIRAKANGSGTWHSASNPLNYVPLIQTLWARRESGLFFQGYAFMRFVAPSVLSDTLINLIRDYINSRLAVF